MPYSSRGVSGGTFGLYVPCGALGLEGSGGTLELYVPGGTLGLYAPCGALGSYVLCGALGLSGRGRPAVDWGVPTGTLALEREEL